MIKPILFNQEMVKAILDGRKMVTRRLINGFIPNMVNQILPTFGYTAFTPKGSISCRGMYSNWHGGYEYGEKFHKMPYQTGDILWVRETWGEWTDGYAYKVPDLRAGYNYPASYIGKWHPSLHMPKAAARIFLKVMDVRVEQLHTMKLNDFLNEGVRINETSFNDPENAFFQAKNQFIELWDSTLLTNKNKFKCSDGAWSTNPWVWVIEFEQCEKPEEWHSYDR